MMYAPHWRVLLAMARTMMYAPHWRVLLAMARRRVLEIWWRLANKADDESLNGSMAAMSHAT